MFAVLQEYYEKIHKNEEDSLQEHLELVSNWEGLFEAHGRVTQAMLGIKQRLERKSEMGLKAKDQYCSVCVCVCSPWGKSVQDSSRSQPCTEHCSL